MSIAAAIYSTFEKISYGFRLCSMFIQYLRSCFMETTECFQLAQSFLFNQFFFFVLQFRCIQPGSQAARLAGGVRKRYADYLICFHFAMNCLLFACIAAIFCPIPTKWSGFKCILTRSSSLNAFQAKYFMQTQSKIFLFLFYISFH